MRVRALLLALTLVGSVLGTWAFLLEPAALVHRESRIRLPDWPQRCDDLRVAVLADLHVGSPHNGLDKLREIVNRTQELEPDLILLAGDYVIHGVLGGSFVHPEEAAAELAHLSAPAGVFAVLGNHDWWHDPAEVTAALETAGIAVLEDRNRRVHVGDCAFWLTGVSDLWEGAHDIHAALRGVPRGAPNLLFTHNPDLFPDVPSSVSLTLAGHTHGGQVYVPGVGRPIVPSAFGERFAIGHIVEEGRHLFVSPGLGTSILPVRFLVPPEISVVRIRGAAVEAVADTSARPERTSETKRGVSSGRPNRAGRRARRAAIDPPAEPADPRPHTGPRG